MTEKEMAYWVKIIKRDYLLENPDVIPDPEMDVIIAEVISEAVKNGNERIQASDD